MWLEYSITNDKPIIHRWYRSGTKRIREDIKDFVPYFYVKETEDVSVLDRHRIVKIERSDITDIYGQRLKKIFVKLPRDVGQQREKFSQTYEADILFPIRYLIDSKINWGDYPDVMYIDIEVDDKEGFPEPSKALYKITCITCYDRLHNVYVSFVLSDNKNIIKTAKKNRISGKDEKQSIYKFTDERDLLNTFTEYLSDMDPDIITGYNVYDFDLPYIVKRMENLGLSASKLSPINRITLPSVRIVNGKEFKEPLDIAGRMIFDLLTTYKKLHITGLNSYSLNDVCKEELGVEKLGKGKRTWQMNEEELLSYNVSDVELIVALDDKVKIIKFFWDLANFVRCPLNWTLFNNKMIDLWILHNAHGNFALPTKPKVKGEDYDGATVLDNKAGIYKDVPVFDLARIYPNIIVSCNLSPECLTATGDINLGNGTKTTSDIGFIPKIILQLFELRNTFEKQKKQTDINSEEYKQIENKIQFVKNLINSIYGVYAYVGFRLYNKQIAESVTYVGRKIIDWTKSVVESRGFTVVYGDTDSIMVQLNGNDDPVTKSKELEQVLNASYDDFAKTMNIKKHSFSIKFEKMFSTVTFLGVKKKYAGYLSWKDGKSVDTFIVKGFEAIRSDNSKFTKKFQLELLKRINKEPDNEKTNKFINDTIDTFKKANVEDIGIPKGLNKVLDEYNANAIHVRAVKYSNMYLGTNFKTGDKPKILYVKKVNKKPKTDVIAFDSTTSLDGVIIDYEKMVDVLLMKKIDNIYKPLGWNYIPKTNLSLWM